MTRRSGARDRAPLRCAAPRRQLSDSRCSCSLTCAAAQDLLRATACLKSLSLARCLADAVVVLQALRSNSVRLAWSHALHGCTLTNRGWAQVLHTSVLAALDLTGNAMCRTATALLCDVLRVTRTLQTIMLVDTQVPGRRGCVVALALMWVGVRASAIGAACGRHCASMRRKHASQLPPRPRLELQFVCGRGLSAVGTCHPRRPGIQLGRARHE